jgi:ATPase subunit of ABC transporter with duplicated ATPase domains
MENVSFRVERGDKIGLVGRNGAGKTTMTKALAGEAAPTDGTIQRSGEIGYLPQDPRSGNPEDTARKRILDARGLGELVDGIRKATLDMASTDLKLRIPVILTPLTPARCARCRLRRSRSVAICVRPGAVA